MTDFSIRRAQQRDLSQIVDLLNPYIQDTAITFDTKPYTPVSRQPWFDIFGDHTCRHQCFVALDSLDNLIAYACSGPLRPKPAYDTSVEVSIYSNPQSHGLGIGTHLYQTLFNALMKVDVHRAHALITLPNAASIRLHQKFNFQEVGVLNEAGRKFDCFHDVCWMEKRIG